MRFFFFFNIGGIVIKNNNINFEIVSFKSHECGLNKYSINQLTTARIIQLHIHIFVVNVVNHQTNNH
jgi:hypothetical protein